MKSNDVIPIAGHQVTLNDDPYQSICLTIFCSGCYFNCEGCQQPELQNPDNGTPMDFNQLKSIIDRHVGLVETICFCGGDWYFYPKQLSLVSTYAKSLGLKTILYTGCEYEKIPSYLLSNIDIVIDGKFDCSREQKIFPASSNQRVFVEGVEVDPSLLPINS